MASVATPGETVDAVITEEEIAKNPRRSDLRKRLISQGLNVVPIDELGDKARRRAGGMLQAPGGAGDRIVAVVECRDGTVVDVIRAGGQAA